MHPCFCGCWIVGPTRHVPFLTSDLDSICARLDVSICCPPPCRQFIRNVPCATAQYCEICLTSVHRKYEASLGDTTQVMNDMNAIILVSM